MVRNDPVAYLASLPERVIFDEIQKAPELLEAIKIKVDRNRKPGRYILTGSCHVLQLEKISDSLAGRMHIIRLHPMAQCEIEQSQSNLLDTLMNCEFHVGRYTEFASPYVQRISAGGYPFALALPREAQRSKWYEDYYHSMVERDLHDIARIERIKNLPLLLKLAATATSRLSNITSLATPLETSRPTVAKYITLLERIFLLERLPAWHSNRIKKLVKMSKLHMVDTGLASALLEVNSNTIENDPSLLGQ